ncbi:hypothetical protein F4703DRAFT_1936733 [Phycomyces blakesleeanus]
MNIDHQRQKYEQWKHQSDIAQVQKTIKDKQQRINVLRQHKKSALETTKRQNAYQIILDTKIQKTLAPSDITLQDPLENIGRFKNLLRLLVNILIENQSSKGSQQIKEILKTIQKYMDQLRLQPSIDYMKCLNRLVDQWNNELPKFDRLESTSNIPGEAQEEWEKNLQKFRSSHVEADLRLQLLYNQYPLWEEKEENLTKRLEERVRDLYHAPEIRTAVIESIYAKAESHQALAEQKSMEDSVKSFHRQALEFEKNYGDLAELKRKTEQIVDSITFQKERVRQLMATNLVYRDHILQQHKHMEEYLHKVRIPTIHTIQKMEKMLRGKVEKEAALLCKMSLFASHDEEKTLNSLKNTVNPLYTMSSFQLLATLANMSLQSKILESNPIQSTVNETTELSSQLRTRAQKWRQSLIDNKILLPETIVNETQEPIDTMLYAAETFRVHIQEQEDAFVLHEKNSLNYKKNMLDSTANTLNSIRHVIDERQWLLDGQWEDCKLKCKTFKEWTSDIENIP